MNKNLAFFLLLLIFSSGFSEKILIKIPTRERPEKFLSVLEKYKSYLSGKHEVFFVVSCDLDDISMNNPQVIQKLSSYSNVFVYFEKRSNKIGAINRDIDKHLDFDILIAGSDDMVPKKIGYDEIIVRDMKQSFPELDGVINYHDGFLGHQLNTIPIIGKKYYNRFNYIYHPSYLSVCCDVELTIVSRLLGKETCSQTVLFEHQHPVYGFQGDDLYVYNESSKFHLHDKTNLHKRMAKNFDLHFSEFQGNILPSSYSLYGGVDRKIKWSILICTLQERSGKFEDLFRKILNQIEKAHLTDKIEVVFFLDNREEPVGKKRNALLNAAHGEYLCFIDDDDDISDQYVNCIYSKLIDDPDCLSLQGVLKSPGNPNRKFYHSIDVKKYHQIGNCYFRFPNHLNVIKSSIAKQFKFPEKNYSEDYDWAFSILESGLLKKEAKIKKFLYIYDYNPKTSATLNR